LLDEDNCKKLATNCFRLLATSDPSSPGTFKKVLFGRTMGTTKDVPSAIDPGGKFFMHNQASLKALFEATSFQDVTVTDLGWRGFHLPVKHSHLTMYAFIAFRA